MFTGVQGADPIKAYLMTTGTIFGLLVVAHVWRVFGEDRNLARDPSYILITLVAAALCLWAFHLLRKTS